MLLVNRRIRFVPNVITLIKRSLKGKGKLLVQAGQEVTPEEIVGKSSVSSGVRVINLAKQLEVAPDQVKNYLQRPIGQKIYKGELLAFKTGGLLESKRIVTAPTDGILEFLSNNGDLMMRFLPREVNLPSAVYGIIEKIDQSKGEVLIKTEATQIYGLFGSGRVREGNIKILGARGDLISKLKIPNSAEHIIIGGSLIYSDAIYAAMNLGISGIITGGINAKDYKAMSGGRLVFPGKMGTDIGISTIVTEGFGSIPIGEDLFNLLWQFNNKFSIIDGNRALLSLPSTDSSCLNRVKKSKLPVSSIQIGFVEPLNSIEAVSLNLNQQVRIIGSIFAGTQGKVINIDKIPTLLESGIRTYLVTVETRSRKIKIPYSNIEVI